MPKLTESVIVEGGTFRLMARHIKDDINHEIEHNDDILGIVERLNKEIADDPEKDYIFYIVAVRN